MLPPPSSPPSHGSAAAGVVNVNAVAANAPAMRDVRIKAPLTSSPLTVFPGHAAGELFADPSTRRR